MNTNEIQTYTVLLQAVTTLILLPLFKYAFSLEKRLTKLEITEELKNK
jgi:hypothetical protein